MGKREYHGGSSIFFLVYKLIFISAAIVFIIYLITIVQIWSEVRNQPVTIIEMNEEPYSVKITFLIGKGDTLEVRRSTSLCDKYKVGDIVKLKDLN